MTDTEYTPSLDDLRVAWMAHHIEATDESPMPMTKWEAEFRRGIEAEKAKAWDEGYEAWRGDGARRYWDASSPQANPYRKEQDRG
ncbi:hypothetical protein [Microbacterium gilvum]|uniref:Uncharacterized protein n=1 Tax=Microbacterium gilvum TaxID=1336204 RepID=A0ABP9A8G9_9MICO